MLANERASEGHNEPFQSRIGIEVRNPERRTREHAEHDQPSN
jgi:hypothetical protein